MNPEPGTRPRAFDRRAFLATAAVAGAATVAAAPSAASASAVRSSAALAQGVPASAANPALGPNAYVFTPAMTAASIQSQLDAAYSAQASNQFGAQRYAFLFLPGTYDVDINVGYYTQVLGLGLTPGQVVITGSLTVDAQWNGGNATENFWRGAENLTVTPSGGTVTWAVAQAGPIRRVQVNGAMSVAPTGEGWASGGFMADCLVTGQVASGSQQQWMSRNDQWLSWSGSVWNMVFVGVQGAPAQNFPAPSWTTVAQTPVVREKPFLYVDASGNYNVFVPALRQNSVGTSWSGTTAAGTSIPITSFYVTSASDTAETMNAALSAGHHLLITPGVYNLDQALNVANANTVVLGLGLATLAPTHGTAAITVADVGGVTVAGLLLDAQATNSPSLLQIGPAGSSADHTANPTAVFDLFARIGGVSQGQATTAVIVNSNNVILDDLWLWRADHGTGVGWTVNTSANGLIVNGQNVTAYGLAVEHFQQTEVIWNGNGGRTYFFQNEMPYDPPSQAAWMDGANPGYPAYQVAGGVTSHNAWGVGSYCNFTAAAVQSQSAFVAPDVAGIDFTDLVTVFLASEGQINHVINNLYGPSDSTTGIYYVSQFVGGSNPVLPTPLSRTGWTATAFASDGTDLPANMIDARTDTRWSSGTTQAATGQWATVNMGSAQRIDLVTLNCGGNDTDFAHGYQLFLSDDGVTWGTAVATAAAGSQLEIISFPAQTAQYIHVVQTGTSSSWWSIADFNAYNGTVGTNPTGPATPLTVTASAFAAGNSVGTETTGDTGGGQDVGWINGSSWLQYNNVNFGSGYSEVQVRLASAAAGSNIGTVQFRLDSLTATPFATVDVNGTGGWQTWQTTATVNASTVPTGTHTLYATFTTTTGGNFVNINWFEFLNPATVTGATPVAITASAFAASNSVGTEATGDTGGGNDVGWINSASWLEYNNVAFGSGLTGGVTARVASAVSGTNIGSIQFRLDSLTATPFATVPVSGTGGWQTWATTPSVTGSPIPTGTHNVYVTFTTATGGNFVNLNWFQFS